MLVIDERNPTVLSKARSSQNKSLVAKSVATPRSIPSYLVLAVRNSFLYSSDITQRSNPAFNYFGPAITLGTHFERRERLFLKFDFINIVKRYLDIQSDSEERDKLVKAQHGLVEEVIKVQENNTSPECSKGMLITFSECQ